MLSVEQHLSTISWLVYPLLNLTLVRRQNKKKPQYNFLVSIFIVKLDIGKETK